MKRVAVIGAGACGLNAIKCCKEENIDVVCFEKTGRIGGLWHYHDSVENEVPSCMKTTVFNTSKEMSAFSDFLPPKEFPNFLPHRYMLKYLLSYAEKFHLLPHIKLHHDVRRVVPTEDYNATGQWTVCYQNDRGIEQEVFDGVMICIGHHGTPSIPDFPGLERFRGSVVHTHSLKTADSFKDSRVLVIGIGNSGLDAAVDISTNAAQVYLSKRRGFWLAFRLGTKGLPSDAELNSRFQAFLIKCMGIRLASYFVEWRLNKSFDHKIHDIKSEHHFFNQHPSINDQLPYKISNGSVKVRSGISGFVEGGVVFKGEGNLVTDIDAVVLATGYKIVFPFLSKGIVKSKNNYLYLYKRTFPPNLPHSSLAVIGLVQTFGPIFPIAEAQSRWYAQMMNGKVKLPTPQVMMEHVLRRKSEMAKRYVDTPRHVLQEDFVPILDEIAVEFGAKPNLFKMAFTDPKLFWKCFFGPCLPYQYRLQGPHPWNGARDAIIDYENRLLYPLKSPTSSDRSEIKNLKFLYFAFFFLVIVTFFAPFAFL